MSFPRLLGAIGVVALFSAPHVFATGETLNGFPTWEERVLHQLINRARVAPGTELAGCGANCSAAEYPGPCYNAVAPLGWNYALNHSSRFHSAAMGRNAFFSHPTPFIIRSDINSLYPATCDGSSSCASSGAGSTDPAPRIALFGAGYSGEIIAAGYGTPYDAFYGWLLENGNGSGCTFTQYNGHRYLILTGGSGVGLGYANVPGSPYTRYYTGDFGPSTAPSKIVSGTHWGAPGSSAPNQRQSSSIDFWANWYDASAPLQATVVVDGVSHVMSNTRGTSTNGAWTTTLGGLGSGCHRYYYQFTDSSSAAVRYPTTGTLGIGDSTCADWTLGAPVRADFNADARSDVIWRKSTTGENAMWLMNGVTIGSPAALSTVSDVNWKMAGVGDFNGDGNADVLWWHSVTGQVVVWLMNGTTMSSAGIVSTVADTNWKIAGAGDFDGDGKSDIVWRHALTGQVVVWLMNGTSMSGSAMTGTVADLNWNIAGIGDFDSDGKADLFWRNGLTGANVVWMMNGGALRTAAVTNTVADLNYKVAGIAGNNVFWSNQVTGDVVLWVMNGGTVTSGSLLTTVSDINWHVEAVGDFDGDGKADLLWRKVTTGDVVVWLMNGTSLRQATYVTTVSDLNWSVVAPR